MVIQLLNHVIDLCEQSGNSDELHEFCRTLGSLKLRLDCGAWTELDSIRSLTVKAVGYVAKIADRKEVYALRQFSTQIVKLSRADDPRKVMGEEAFPLNYTDGIHRCRVRGFCGN